MLVEAKSLLSTCNYHHLCVPPATRLKYAFVTTLIQSKRNSGNSRSVRARAEPTEGPIELPSAITDVFATSDEPSPLQTATSLLLTGAIAVLLFRSARRRAKRAKEQRLRSKKKTLKEEAVESLKAITPTPVDAKAPPSPAQALLGGLTAGVIALLLYKFTVTVEDSLNRQALSDNFSVRQITITIRTIVNGLCYLATFVFGINSIGLFLYSGQLALNLMGDSSSQQSNNKGEAEVSSKEATSAIPVDSTEGNKDDSNKISEDTK